MGIKFFDDQKTDAVGQAAVRLEILIIITALVIVPAVLGAEGVAYGVAGVGWGSLVLGWIGAIRRRARLLLYFAIVSGVIRHGPVTCYCYMPCISSVNVVEMQEIKMHEYALLEDTRDPSNTKYIYGPTLFRMENPWQQLGHPQTTRHKNNVKRTTENKWG